MNRTGSIFRGSEHFKVRVGSVVLAAAGVFIGLCLLTYSPEDVALLSYPAQHPVANWGGTVGVWIGFFGRTGFGWASFVIPALCGMWAWRLWRDTLPEIHGLSFMITNLCLISSAGTLIALAVSSRTLQVDLGGIVGFFLADRGSHYLGTIGTLLTAGCVSLLSWVVVSGVPLRVDGIGLLRRVGGIVASILRRPATAGASLPATRLAPPPVAHRDRHSPGPPLAIAGAGADAEGDTPLSAPPGGSPRVRIRSTVEQKRKVVPTPPRRERASGEFQLPPLDLLTDPPPLSERKITEDLQANARVLEETLREFGLEATVVNIDRGPSVTRYELIPAPGVKLTKIVALSDDLALVMKAANCHVVAPIPGKGTVGIDVPNTTTTMVYLKEIITSHEFTSSTSPLILPIGTDVSGRAIVTDLRECPHLLIAGATGSGKTVCLNSVLTGILSHASPEQVKFLMIDPKMVELAMFNNIPHLVGPVVTSAKKASVALHWAVEEMERRYQLLSRAGVRNIDFYNKRVASGQALSPTPAGDEDGETPEDGGALMPYLVIVIDELADLMMIASQDVESAITRLAQLSRAVGIHIILSTQRPSVDVITGVIKANFPARIAFQVASKVDSRTILDVNGADKLLGRGDLMFLRPGTAKPIRVQGAFVTDAEIEQITAFLKQQGAPIYDERLLEKSRQPGGGIGTITEKDELYEMAKEVVLNTGQASTSLLQRRLRLGYGRAARILDLMEQEGIVGPPQGSRPREILVSRDAVEQKADT